MADLKIPSVPLQLPLSVRALNGISLEPITHHSVPVKLKVSGKDAFFLVIERLHATIVLGCPWLNQHNPHIDWIKNTVFAHLLFLAFMTVPLNSFLVPLILEAVCIPCLYMRPSL